MALPEPEFPYVEERIYNSLSSDGEWGPITRRSRFPEVVRRFKLTYNVLSESEKASIESEFNSSKGGAGVFSHTPVGDVSAVNVRFVANTLKFSMFSGAFWRCSFEIEEVLLDTST